jgi:hypothetical protein
METIEEKANRFVVFCLGQNVQVPDKVQKDWEGGVSMLWHGVNGTANVWFREDGQERAFVVRHDDTVRAGELGEWAAAVRKIYNFCQEDAQ